MEASQGQEFRLVLSAIATTASTLAWIFNDDVEVLLGLDALKLLRRAPSLHEKNCRGVVQATDPFRLPVTFYMLLLTVINCNLFDTNPYYALFALFLRLYLVGEMWTRNMPRIFRCVFDFGIRTNYFEPIVLLLGLILTEGDTFFDFSVILVLPWVFVSLNPDTPMAALISWSATTSCILSTRFKRSWAEITLVQVSKSLLIQY